MTLESWLDTATHTLTPDAAQRIQDEYLAAFADAQMAGETDILAAWGDPRRVNRELRRVHLTGADMKALNAISSSDLGADTKGWSVGGLWFTLLMVGVYSHIGHKYMEMT